MRLTHILSYILPESCLLCGSRVTHIAICEPCQKHLPWITSSCTRCGLPLENFNPGEALCGQCLQTAPPFSKTLGFLAYEGPIKQLITGLKFHNQLNNAKCLGQLMAIKLQQYYQNQSLPEIILPVPLHRKRLQQRGFNQAIEIARPISKVLKLAIDSRYCRRIKATPAQSGLNASERKKNLRGSFRIKGNHNYKHVAIVDDVVTTGSTIKEFSLTLQKASIERIDVWCCARASARIML